MRPHLLLPRNLAGPLSPLESAYLQTLIHHARAHGPIIPAPNIIFPSDSIDSVTTSLTSRGHILLENNHVAPLSILRRELKKEVDRNAKAVKRHRKPPGWPLHRRVAQAFPSTCPPQPKAPVPASYCYPSAFGPTITDHQAAGGKAIHRTRRPGDVQEIAGPYAPHELPALLQILTEQTAARREVWILYTRKNAYVGTRHRTHVPK